MLLKFSCSNHKSIKDKVTYTAIAGKDDTNETELKEYGKYRVLRSAAIYGPNGSGKSNFLSALGFMAKLVSASLKIQPGVGIFQAPHKLSEPGTPSTYDIQFVKNDIRYAYGFSVKNNVIVEEYLYYFPNGRITKIFEREGNNILPGDKYKGTFELSEQALKDNRLFLSCAANYSSKSEIENAFMFFSEDIVFYDPNLNNWTEYSIDLMQNDDKIKKKFLKILEMFETGIKDVDAKLEKISTVDSELPSEIPESIVSIIKNSSQEQNIVANKMTAKTIYEYFDIDLVKEESSGIKKLFEIICPIMDILEKGKVLIFDEIEYGLHEAVVCEIIKMFKDANKENFAQLIFSTHDTSLLSKNLFRRDQVWLTQQRDDRSTDLYSLVEVKNVRKTENMEKGYLMGKYGAIPMLSNNVYNIFDEGQQ